MKIPNNIKSQVWEGKVLKYTEKDVNTDLLWPGRLTYGNFSMEEAISMGAMKGFDSDFFKKLEGRSILVVGENFGCGSSREQPSSFLRQIGINAVISPYFSRIFYRNSINAGLLVVESEEASRLAKTDDYMMINPKDGRITINRKAIEIQRYDDEIINILERGGIIEYLSKMRRA